MDARSVIRILNECTARGTDAYGLAIAVAAAFEEEVAPLRARSLLLQAIADNPDDEEARAALVAFDEAKP